MLSGLAIFNITENHSTGTNSGFLRKLSKINNIVLKMSWLSAADRRVQ